jgi:hypothetical protein
MTTIAHITELDNDAFEALLLGTLGSDHPTPEMSPFFGTLAAMDEYAPEIIELSAHLENGSLVLDTPATLEVDGNKIFIQNKQIVIRLREAA